MPVRPPALGRGGPSREAGRAGDPLAALVLADVADRRRLLEWVESYAQRRDGGKWESYPEDNEAARAVRLGMERGHEMQGYALRYLMTRYAGHPRFRPEWRIGR